MVQVITVKLFRIFYFIISCCKLYFFYLLEAVILTIECNPKKDVDKFIRINQARIENRHLNEFEQVSASNAYFHFALKQHSD